MTMAAVIPKIRPWFSTWIVQPLPTTAACLCFALRNGRASLIPKQRHSQELPTALQAGCRHSQAGISWTCHKPDLPASTNVEYLLSGSPAASRHKGCTGAVRGGQRASLRRVSKGGMLQIAQMT